MFKGNKLIRIWLSLLLLLIVVSTQSFVSFADSKSYTRETEPNNIKNQANTVNVNNIYVGNLSNAEDVDWFSFTLSKKGLVNLVFDLEDQDGGSYDRFFKVTLLNDNLTELDSRFVIRNPHSLPVNFDRIGLYPGKYYVKIESDDAHVSSDYSFRVHYEEDEYCEVEPNGSEWSANEIITDRLIRGRISNTTDEDWYRLFLEDPSYVTLKLEHFIDDPGYPRYELALKAPNSLGDLEEIHSFWGTGKSLITSTAPIYLTSGLYYIRIVGAQPGIHYTTGDYNYIVNTHGKNKWVKGNNKWYYITSKNTLAKGWLKIGGKWYYFDSANIMKTGWQKVSGKWYYFDGSGAMKIGWQKVSGKWYYLDNSGAMVTGWQKISGKWYYLESSGAMVTGWKKISNKWYYFSGSGAMATGWQKLAGYWYYLGGDGAMRTGWQKISNKWYYFYSDGRMAFNTTIGGYVLGPDGAMK